MLVKLILFFSEKEDARVERGSSDGNVPDHSEVMDTSDSAAKIVSSQSVVGQICFDLGTLYFYKGNVEEAKSLFEICSSVQVVYNCVFSTAIYIAINNSY